jgi:hypothetical protein
VRCSFMMCQISFPRVSALCVPTVVEVIDQSDFSIGASVAILLFIWFSAFLMCSSNF